MNPFPAISSRFGALVAPILFLVFVVLGLAALAPGAFAQQNSCRTPEAAVPSRFERDFAGVDQPPVSIHVEFCSYVEQILAAENTSPISNGTATFHNAAVIVEASFDPQFRKPFMQTTISLAPSVSFIGPPFDGSFDFGGTSGVTEAFEESRQTTVDIPISPQDAAFFMQPTYRVYVRSRWAPGFSIDVIGPGAAQIDGVWATGLVIVPQFGPPSP